MSTGQLSSGIVMATQNSSMPGFPSMPGQFIPMQGPSTSMQCQISAPVIFASYSPPPQPPSQMNSQM